MDVDGTIYNVKSFSGFFFRFGELGQIMCIKRFY